MSGGDIGFEATVFGPHTSVESAQGGVTTSQALGGHTKGLMSPRFNLFSLTTDDFATGNFVIGCQP